MLSISYQAFYELELLRSHANMSAKLLSECVLEIPNVSYSRIIAEIQRGGDGGLNGATEFKVRRSLSIMIFGFKKKLLPLPIGKDVATVNKRHIAVDQLVADYMIHYRKIVDSDRAGYFKARKAGNATPETLTETLAQAAKFSSTE